VSELQGYFAVFQLKGNPPVLAGCTRCGRKFLTPKELLNNPAAAREYLLGKYLDHRCPYIRETIRLDY
jgi:hypothetical protein